MRIMYLLLSVTFLLLTRLIGMKQESSIIFQHDQPGNGEISMPIAGQVVQGAVIIKGNTSVDGFLSCEIDFAYASDPSQSWFLVQESTSPVLESILAIWDTSVITDGDYNLRLLINQAGDSQEIIEITRLHVRNYTPIETQTPAPTKAYIDSINAISKMTASPLVTSTAMANFAPPSQTALPANPSEISAAQVGLTFAKGVAVALGIFSILGAYLGIRMFINNHK
ncbi:MAG: hypothetical protein A2Y88_10090 [Chloroflexi bacterium RBG_13_48_10]|nr:MAG: hypothetical protein A2Y88_10090 [Chloroflexi bacterium RBG_13_48_10]